MGQRNPKSQVKPLTPEEAAKLSKAEHEASIPDEVIEAFNELIKKNWRTWTATVGQHEVIQLAVDKSGGRLSPTMIYDNKWLDVEELFRKSGWEVDYDKPAYNETYEPTFKFSWPEKRPSFRYLGYGD